MDALLAAVGLVCDPATLISLTLACLFGFILGALPGLTATMAVALLVPITFFLSPIAAIASIVAAAATAIFAGDVPGALLRMPGTPASAAYVDDAFALTRQGKVGLVLGLNALCSAIGGVIGTVVLVLFAPVLANFALKFSTFEFFWLACLGLTCSVFISTEDPLKGTISLLLGIFIATVGMDYTTGYPRFTFENPNLYEGISFIPALIGMFALSEIIRTMLGSNSQTVDQATRKRVGFSAVLQACKEHWRHVLRGSALGTSIGILPGAGADIASWISSGVARRFSRHPDTWGKGNLEGIVAGSSANNAALSGAWVPALVFAIPGDTITAIAIGVLYLKGMNPGPTIFVENADLLYAVFICFFLANLLLLPIGLIAIRFSGFILSMRREFLMPPLLVLAAIGAFAIDNTVFGILVMLVLGVLAYILEENQFPVAPMVLGIVLGRLVEQHLMQSLISTQGSVIGLFERPMAGVLGAITLAVWLFPAARWAWRKVRA